LKFGKELLLIDKNFFYVTIIPTRGALIEIVHILLGQNRATLGIIATVQITPEK